MIDFFDFFDFFKMTIAVFIIATVAAFNNTMLWGTYRPNLYFGMRTRVPESILTGIMWYGLDIDQKPWESV
jgi:hypothetical protein